MCKPCLSYICAQQFLSPAPKGREKKKLFYIKLPRFLKKHVYEYHLTWIRTSVQLKYMNASHVFSPEFNGKISKHHFTAFDWKIPETHTIPILLCFCKSSLRQLSYCIGMVQLHKAIKWFPFLGWRKKKFKKKKHFKWSYTNLCGFGIFYSKLATFATTFSPLKIHLLHNIYFTPLNEFWIFVIWTKEEKHILKSVFGQNAQSNDECGIEYRARFRIHKYSNEYIVHI